jgi:hypothetical protein
MKEYCVHLMVKLVNALRAHSPFSYKHVNLMAWHWCSIVHQSNPKTCVDVRNGQSQAIKATLRLIRRLIHALFFWSSVMFSIIYNHKTNHQGGFSLFETPFVMPWPFLDPHLTIYHSNIGVRLEPSNHIRHAYFMWCYAKCWVPNQSLNYLLLVS